MGKGLCTVLLLTGVLAATTGCPPKQGPERAVARYRSAVGAERAGEAWGLLDPAARRRCVWDAFQARVAEGSGRFAEADPQLDGLRAVWGEEGPAVSWDGERWQIERGVLGLYPRDTPARALRSFVGAYRAQRWSVLLSMAPQRVRASLTAEQIREKEAAGVLQDLLEPRVHELEEALAAGEGIPTIEGSRAQLEYGPYRAVLERTSEGWVVLDL